MLINTCFLFLVLDILYVHFIFDHGVYVYFCVGVCFGPTPLSKAAIEMLSTIMCDDGDDDDD